MDRREESHDTTRGIITIAPDVLADFTDMPFEDDLFWHVVFDPPHHTSKRLGETDGEVAKRYGRLVAGWQEMLRAGFEECFRVLRPNGTLIFKWCSSEIPLADVLALTPEKPLYGHRSGKQATTHWVAFIKQNVEVHTPAAGVAASNQVEGRSDPEKSDSGRAAGCGATPCSRFSEIPIHHQKI